MTLVSLKNVSKSYGRQEIIRAAGFQLSAGERAGLVGPNGAGKTTLLRLILGLESPDSGAVHRARGLTIGHLPQEVGQVGQEPLLQMVMAIASDVKAIESELDVVVSALAEGPVGQELVRVVLRVR